MKIPPGWIYQMYYQLKTSQGSIYQIYHQQKISTAWNYQFYHQLKISQGWIYQIYFLLPGIIFDSKCKLYKKKCWIIRLWKNYLTWGSSATQAMLTGTKSSLTWKFIMGNIWHRLNSCLSHLLKLTPLESILVIFLIFVLKFYWFNWTGPIELKSESGIPIVEKWKWRP